MKKTNQIRGNEMRIVNTINLENSTNEFWNGSGALYLKNDNLRVARMQDSIKITDLTNALKRGKDVVSYTINWNRTGDNSCDIMQDLLIDIGYNFSALFHDVLNQIDFLPTSYGGFKSIENNGLTYYKSVEKGIRQFSPFNLDQVKPLKTMPKKWTLSHAIRILINDQFENLKCTGKYTDDYAFDAAYDFQQGKIADRISFVKRIIERPSGWWVSFRENKLSICCHTFDLNSCEPMLAK